MNIVLGFGSTETENENKEYEAIEAIVRKAMKLDQFSEERIDFIKAELGRRAEELQEYNRQLSEAHYVDAPERYYYMYPYVLGDVNCVCVGVKFHHINTRHPLSPDGIALLQTHKAYWFDYLDLGLGL